MKRTRRRFLHLTGAATTGIVAGCSNLRRSFTSKERTPTVKPPFRWHYSIHDPSSWLVFGLSEPAEGRILVSGGRLTAVDTETGKPKWHFSQQMGPVTTHDGLVFVYNGSASSGVGALSLADGSFQWSTHWGHRWNVGKPVVQNGSVIVGDKTGAITALSVTDGTKQWQVQATDVIVGLAAVDNTVVAADQKGTVLGITLQNGEPRWTKNFPGETWSDVAITGDGVYVAHGNTVAKLDPYSGQAQWQFSTDYLVHGIIERDGIVFASDTGSKGEEYEGHLYALSASSGKEQYRITDLPTSAKTAPAADETAVYLGTKPSGTSDGPGTHLYAFDTQSGKQLSKLDVERIEQPPVVTEELIYVAQSTVVHAIEKDQFLPD